ncbi:MAG: helix-hairpin-helix domain-containing protein, partial [Phycisphaerales bacterium]
GETTGADDAPAAAPAAPAPRSEPAATATAATRQRGLRPRTNELALSSRALARRSSAAGGQQGSSGRSSGGGGAGTGADGRAAVRDLDAAQLRGILREASNDNFAQRVQGRVNINTAPAALLKDVMQIDPRVADAIVARRNSSPRGIVSIADLQGMSGLTPALLTQIAQQCDVTSSVYTVTSRGRSAPVDAEVEIEAVVDRSTYPATIVSYRER